jgi:hypothetical protein
VVIRTRDRRQLWLPLPPTTHVREEDTVVTKSEAFPSKWLIPADLEGGSAVVTINKAVLEPMKDFNGADTRKVVLYFTSKYKPLPLNRTNFDAVADIAGTDETDDWEKVKIELFVTQEFVKGKLTDVIRIRKPGGAVTKKKPATKPDPKPDFNDEVKY